jgi:hypothetical protein
MPSDWVSEDIPNPDVLFMRVHRQYVNDGNLQPGVFRDREGAMSTHWKKYCQRAEDARLMAKKPEDNGVVSMVAGDVRSVPLGVVHTPDIERRDRSHTDVRGEKSSEARMKLLEIVRWEISTP